MGMLIGPQPDWAEKNLRSLRFNSPDSAYLNRTPGTAGNRKTWTWAGWVKRSGLGSVQRIFAGWNGAANNDDYTGLLFWSDDTLRVGGYSLFFRTSNAVFRDVSAWMHVTFIADLDNANNALKFRVWINNTELTWTGTGSNPSTTGINAAASHSLGSEAGGSDNFCNLYLADIHFIDGQALEPSNFGYFDEYGVWQPKRYFGPFGTNGFFLNFADNSSTTALGYDTSGNNNHWTPNNFSVTAGAGNDSFLDHPRNFGVEGRIPGGVRGNYATLNPLANGATLSNGNLDITGPASGYGGSIATIGLDSGKYYWEYTITNNYADASICGISARTVAPFSNLNNANEVYYQNTYTVTNGTQSGVLGKITVGDVIGISWDGSVREVKFYRNNSLQATRTANDVGTYFPGFGGIIDDTASANFGQRPFAHTPPAGFKALCSTNLPTPRIKDGSTAMDVKLYTGNGSTQTISGLNFSPDFVWIKSRSGSDNHAIQDAVRGATYVLQSNTTNAEVNAANTVGSFTSDGFTLAGGAGSTNGSSVTYAAWTWDAGSSTVSNTDGSITSNVRANASAGFSIVTWTRASTADNIGHGLGVAPNFIICKSRTSTIGWMIGHVGLDPTSPWNYRIFFDTDARNPDGATSWNGVPTSSVFYTGNTGYIAGDMVAYCFAPVAGYSSFGSYTGNGSADGTFVYTGFSPRWLMVKRTNSTENWYIIDTARDTYNISGLELYPNLSNAESTGFGNLSILDVVSNGFKFRATNPGYNASSSTYIYAAFAESPFKTSRAR